MQIVALPLGPEQMPPASHRAQLSVGGSGYWAGGQV